ncbi:hypothetical protein CAPTEDRAFT_211167 [Capitella teleta]|uniref:Uncharacterized protein n=1 Tax=Capitella teleta TaxID=283909 RepID=R7UB61_CAPTE|nr:hypothetical protein CAPTEDRAFT_211167 [Capitella teleta]|eukprot:ELU03229.1 hypothetical protein CAPTEDRAFT_211167 [Capitella teleta]
MNKRKRETEPKGSSVQLKTFKKWEEEPEISARMDAIIPEIRGENDTNMVVKVYAFPKVHGTRFINHVRKGLTNLLNNWPVLKECLEKGTESGDFKGNWATLLPYGIPEKSCYNLHRERQSVIELREQRSWPFCAGSCIIRDAT